MKIFGEGEYLFFWRKRKPEKEKEENIWRRRPKDIEKSRFRSRDFCQFLEGFGFGFGEFGLEKKSLFWFRKILSQKKVSVLVSENMVSETKYWFRFRKIWSLKKVSFSEKSLGIGFGIGIVVGIIHMYIVLLSSS